MLRVALLVAVLGSTSLFSADKPEAKEYRRRVDTVRRTSGFVALWDFVLRENGASGRFAAHQRKGDTADLRLEAANYVLDYWGEGRRATYEDFPLLGRGPFGQAIRFRVQKDLSFRPLLWVPRDKFHDSALDAKGPGKSVSMVVWMARETGNHAVAGIWHEGTDLKAISADVRRVEAGRRQYGMFTGLAANDGGSAAHISENGGPSFGDKFARNLSVTREVTRKLSPTATDAEIDQAWAVMGFVFDNARNTVTSYLDGEANEYWIDNPQQHPFFKWPANGWKQADLAQTPGMQEGEDPAFDPRQYYTPPERRPIKRTIINRTETEVVELQEFEFTKVRVVFGRDANGTTTQVVRRELAALRANPFWFPHDIYSPKNAKEGGPFTIGEFIHTSRSQGFTGYLGGVAVFDQPLSGSEMRKLATVGRKGGLLRP